MSSSSESESEVSDVPVRVRGRPKAKKDSFIELEERFDQHKLNYIIKNKDTLRDKMRAKCFEDDYDPFNIAQKYLSKSTHGIIKAKYKQNASFGRFYAVNSLSLQSMPREIRHTIANEFYADIDIKNAHPVILAHLCSELGVSCKLLKKYNKNRDEYLSQISNDKEHAKTVILSIINGGKRDAEELENPPEWLKEFKKEMKQIYKKFATDKAFKSHKKKREENDKDYNHEASYMNTLLCDFENKILQVIYKALNSPKTCVLCFDGLMIPKSMFLVFDCQKLGELEEAVKEKLDIKIKLAVKEMNEGFDISLQNLAECKYTENPKNTFDFDDTYTYSDFYNQFNAKDAEDVLEDVLYNAPRVIAHCNKGKGCYIKKLENGYFDIVDKLGTSGFKLKTAKAPMKLDDIISSSSMRSFGDIKCELSGCSEKHFNMWSGFQAKRVSLETESEGFKLMKAFIMECWADNNQEHYNYIISWLAGLVTNLNGVNLVALVMVSKQGAGKGTLIEFMELILRSINVVSIAGLGSVTKNFNKILEGKRLVNINEISSAKEEFKSNFEIMKSMITDPTITIEPKGVDAYSIRNTANFILFTNHDDAIIVEESDRRYAIFEMKGHHRNDKEYFSKIRQTCFTQDVANEFYTYLLDFQAVNISNIIETDIRLAMKSLSKSSPLKYIEDLMHNEELKETLFEDGKRVKADALYTRYRNWCVDNGERNIMTSTKFGISIKDKLTKKHTRVGTVYELM